MLLGGVAFGLIAVGVGLASEPTETPIPAPTVTPTPIPFVLPEVPDKSQAPVPPTERSNREADSGQGMVYTWDDGGRSMRVVLQADLVVQKTSADTPEDAVIARGSGDSIVRRQAGHIQEARPVFRSESGGGLMMLPGGVLLALDPLWDEGEIESFFSSNNISTDRISELEFLQNGFLVETEPGFPSLDLANLLADQEGVLISSPNWWSEVETK